MDLVKLKRELYRLVHPVHWYRQLRYQGQRVQTGLFGAPVFEDYSAALPKVDRGDHLIGLVLYAPSGIRPDTLSVLSALASIPTMKPFVMCNHTMTDQDKRQLKTLGVPYVQAHNRGWDFGTYRNFCLTAHHHLNPESLDHIRLTFMNDSFIFPLMGQGLDFLKRLQGPGFCGPIEQTSSQIRSRHLCSFCISFSGSKLRDSAFVSFWRGYRPLADRFYTIRSGEVGFSRAMLSAGHDLHPAFSKQDLLKAVTKADRADLLAALVPLVHLALLSKEEAAKLAEGESHIVRERIHQLIKGYQNLRLLPLYTIFLDLPFAKVRDLKDYPRLNDWYLKTYGLGLS